MYLITYLLFTFTNVVRRNNSTLIYIRIFLNNLNNVRYVDVFVCGHIVFTPKHVEKPRLHQKKLIHEGFDLRRISIVRRPTCTCNSCKKINHTDEAKKTAFVNCRV